MSKLTLNDLTNLQNEQSAVTKINQNNALIEAAMDKALFRDGTSPNQMSADIDMNSNDILNADYIRGNHLIIDGYELFPKVLPKIGDKEILSNISGEEAQPIGNTLSNILDVTLSNSPGSLPFRFNDGWRETNGSADPNAVLFGDGAWHTIPGGGNMLSSIYDPQNIASDIYSLIELETAEYASTVFAPVTAPQFIRTAFYNSDRLKDSGALYLKNGTTTGTLVITLSDGITHVGYDIATPTISLTSFGIELGTDPSVSTANMAALKAAIAATPVNGTLYIPDIGGTVYYANGPDFSNVARINKKINVRVDGHMRTTYSAYQTDPAYLIWVTHDDVCFYGSGTIEGDGNFSIGGDTTLNMPGLIFVDSCSNFQFSGIKIRRPPQIGLYIAGCHRAVVRDCIMEGGPTSFHSSYLPPEYVIPDPDYAGSAHFGIVATGGGDHIWQNIRFCQDESNGMFINCIFPSGVSGNSNGNKTIGCIAYYPWEKLLYGYGDKQVILGNTVYGSYGNTHTEGIRIWGSDCIMQSNVCDGCRGGLQVLDGARNIINGNLFKNCRASGINVQHFSNDYTGGCDNNVITNNYISRQFDSVEKRFAIRVSTNALQDISGCIVDNNVCIGWGDDSSEVEYTIQMTALSPRVMKGCSVKNNKINSCGNGIKLSRNVSGHVTGNDFLECTSIAIHIDQGAKCVVADNTGENPGTYFLSYSIGGLEPSGTVFRNNYSVGAGNIGIRNHTFNSNSIWAEGNQWTATPLVVPFTLSTSAAVTTITHGGVAPHATILIASTSQPLGEDQATKGLYAGPDGNNINIVTANGTNASASSTGRIVIIQ